MLERAVEIAREAGALVKGYYERRVGYESKGEFDLVTEADRASEKLIVEGLRASFPEHNIVAEEGSGHKSASPYTWFVDPLDGTTNFAHGFPMFNVTMALAREGEVVLGLVLDPLRPELFTAERGGGAYLNGAPILVSKTRRVADSLSSTGFPSRKRHHNVNIHFYYQLAMASHGTRRTGSAAIDLAYVSAGRLDFFWEFGLKPWDMAAGSLLVEEAGGRISDMRGGSKDLLYSDNFLADNGALHDEVLGMFAEIFRGELKQEMPAIPQALEST